MNASERPAERDFVGRRAARRPGFANLSPHGSLSAVVASVCALLFTLAASLAEAGPAPLARAPEAAVEGAFDATPWIADLHEIRTAFAEKYANLEWAVWQQELDLSDLFARTESRLKDATSDADAKAAIERLLRAFGDGHVGVRWPRTQSASRTSGAPPETSLCQRLGYDAVKGGRALGPSVPGYQPLSRGVTADFPAGLIESAGRKVGVIRIGLFGPQSSPKVCESVVRTLAIAADAPCDDACADKIESAAYTILGRDLATRIEMLRKLGATVMLIDLTGNGGGSDWTEAAARIVSPKPLRSERMNFVRGEHWTHHWESLAKDLQGAAEKAPLDDKAQLTRWALDVDAARTRAAMACPAAPFWSGRRADCEWLGQGFYATGLIAAGDASALRKKPWGSLVFTPAEYEFRQGVWPGPLIVLVDGNTASAAEEFTAVLQDNRAAIVIGAPTIGAGCGHTDGGTPTKLSHSGGVLELPDCVRIRADGSNEVGGIDPDVLIGFRSSDGMRHKGLRLAAVLPRAVAAAVQLCARERCEGVPRGGQARPR